MKKRMLAWCGVMAVVLMTPAMTLARQYQEEREIIDARLEGYGDKVNVNLPSSGTALIWLLLIFLTAICVSVLFKDAKRSHLD